MPAELMRRLGLSRPELVPNRMRRFAIWLRSDVPGREAFSHLEEELDRLESSYASSKPHFRKADRTHRLLEKRLGSGHYGIMHVAEPSATASRRCLVGASRIRS